jgi:putative PIN family toxin of toxin-antitoxin system
MRFVLDTSVLVAAVRSSSGASAELIRQVFAGNVVIPASVLLFLEYEEVLTRGEHLAGAGATAEEMIILLDALAERIDAVKIKFLWRPQLRDADDEMVLETAINGQADAIVTFNRRDFAVHAEQFGIAILTPGEAIGKL